MKSQRTGVFKALPKEAVNAFNPQISQNQGHTPFFLEVRALPWYPLSSLPVLTPQEVSPTCRVPCLTWPLGTLQFLFSPVCFSPENLRMGRGLFSPQRCEQAEGEEVMADALRGLSIYALNICLSHPRSASVLFIADHLFLMGWEERWPGSQRPVLTSGSATD